MQITNQLLIYLSLKFCPNNGEHYNFRLAQRRLSERIAGLKQLTPSLFSRAENRMAQYCQIGDRRDLLELNKTIRKRYRYLLMHLRIIINSHKPK